MRRMMGFGALLVVVAISVVFGMVLGGKLNAPEVSFAAGASPSQPAAAFAAGPVQAPSFADIAEAAIPAVVGVSNTQVRSGSTAEADPHQQFRNDPFFRYFFGPGPDEERNRRPSPERRLGFASGFIVSDDGYILTNHHVVEDATRLEVSLNDGAKYEAKVIGTDPSIDLALLKIDPQGKKLPVLILGDSDTLRVGEWVVAIGNPLNFDYTVTVGVISAKRRRVPIGGTDAGIANFLQTDAAINFGNSGGPLLDGQGRVVGINTAITRFNSAEGIGFALPINDARSAMEQLRDSGTVRRGYIGITMNQAGINDSARDYLGLPDTLGVMVQAVEPKGPAGRAGIRRGDVIRTLDGEKVRDNQDLVSRIAARRPGERVVLEVFRDGKTSEYPVTLGTRPDVPTMTRGGPGDEGPEGDDAAPEEPTEASGLGLTVEPLSAALRRRFDLPDTARGVVVSDVEIDSEAAERGMERDMIVTRINDQEIAGLSDWQRIVRGLKPGAAVRLEVRVPGREPASDVFLRVPAAKE